MRKSVVALALVLRRHPRHRSCRPSRRAAGDPKVVIIVGATHGATAELPRGRRRRLRRGASSTPRTSSRSTARTRRGRRSRPRSVGASSSSTWATATAGRARTPTTRSTRPRTASASTRRPGRATTTTSTTASRTSRRSTSRRARSCSSTTCATPRATPSRATPSRASRSPASAPTTTPPGFLKAGASAVIADGHAGAERYLRALFTTHQSIEDMWRTMPNPNGNVGPFASMRTPGATVFQDPDTPTSGFYRSLAIGTIGVTTDEVISAGYGDTGANPTSLVVPGNAAVGDRGRRRCTAASTRLAGPAATLPGRDAAPRRRAAAQATADGAAAGRRSRASTTRRSPASWSPPTSRRATARRRSSASLDAGRTVLAERRRAGRHGHDHAAASPRSVAWTLRVRNAGDDVLFETTGTRHHVPGRLGRAGRRRTGPRRHVHRERQRRRRLGQRARPARPARSSSTPRAPTLDGAHPRRRHDPVVLARTATASATRSPSTATNGETGTLIVRVRDAGGDARQEVDASRTASAADDAHLERQDRGRRASSRTGPTRSGSSPRDVAGNTGEGVDRRVERGRRAALGRPRAGPSSSRRTTTRWPKATTLSFALARPMTVTWTIRNAAGADRQHAPGRRRAAGRDPVLDVRRPHDRRHDAAARPLHLVRDRHRRDADRDADGTRSTRRLPLHARATRRRAAASRSR